MDAGIQIAGEAIERPDAMQRARYIAIHLVNGVLAEREATIAAMSTYLAQRYPQLKEVRATENHDEVRMALVFDDE